MSERIKIEMHALEQTDVLCDDSSRQGGQCRPSPPYLWQPDARHLVFSSPEKTLSVMCVDALLNISRTKTLDIYETVA